MINLVLFPSSYFSKKKVDEDLQSEYDAVKATGLFDTILFGYDTFANEGRLCLSERPSAMRKAIMRGWMMKPELYRRFYDELAYNNIELITSPEAYEQMHIFPNVYSLFGDDTAAIKLYPLHRQIDIEDIKQQFNRFIVKDFVKSVKGTEFPQFFDASISQDDFDEWMKVFYKYRGSLLTGGICVKEFLDLRLYGNRTNEYRVFYANKEIVSVSKNSGQQANTTEPPMELIEKYRKLPSCYYTVDFAELADGSWKVMEAGDGSVSGLSESQNAEAYFRALYYALNENQLTPQC